MTRTRLTRPERTAQTRRHLLDAAARLFCRDGYHATTLEAIAEEAGYTKGAVYSAFESKADLFLSLLDEVIDERLADIRSLFEEQPLGPERVRSLARRRIEDDEQQWSLLAIEFWVHAAREPDLREQFAVRYRRMRRGLAELASETSTPLGADDWALVTLALVNGLALERAIDPGVPDDLMAATQRLIYPPRGA